MQLALLARRFDESRYKHFMCRCVFHDPLLKRRPISVRKRDSGGFGYLEAGEKLVTAAVEIWGEVVILLQTQGSY